MKLSKAELGLLIKTVARVRDIQTFVVSLRSAEGLKDMPTLEPELKMLNVILNKLVDIPTEQENKDESN